MLSKYKYRTIITGLLGSGFVVATAMAAAGVDFSDIGLRELYSCFPVAVRSQLHEFGMDDSGDLTVMGGMTFGGGPLNNFVLQSTVRIIQTTP